MNRLSSSETFKIIVNQFPNIGKCLSYPTLEKYTIPAEYYDYKFKSIASTKHILVRPTLRLAKEGRLKLINFSDPANMAYPAVILPDYFSCITITDDKKNTLAYANAMKRSGFMRNTKTKDIESLKLDEVSLYAYLQCAATGYVLSTKDEELTNNVKFVSSCAEIFANIVANCIDRAYPFGGETKSYIVLTFLTALYFFQVHAGYTPERSIPLALKLRIVDPQAVWSDCRTLANEDVKMSSFADFCGVLEREFTHVKTGAINLRTVTAPFVKSCGNGAFFALEHFQSFLNMLQMVDLGVGLFNDRTLRDKISKPLIDSINQILLSNSGD